MVGGAKAPHVQIRLRWLQGKTFRFFKFIKIFFIIDSGAKIVEEFDVAVLFNVDNGILRYFQENLGQTKIS